MMKYRERKAEIVSVNLEDNNGEILMVITTCVPPKTNSWSKEDYEKIIEDTIKCLSKLTKINKRLLLVGDFSCKEINWETFKAGGNETAWGERFLKLTTENTMMQWMTENTRYVGDDEPVKLDLILTKGMNLTKELRYMCFWGKK
uniref:Uncharacterized protein n=1 Tax=Scylla olivacea TaxID=85551 RepID=A0A0P4VVH6_SCYOL